MVVLTSILHDLQIQVNIIILWTYAVIPLYNCLNYASSCFCVKFVEDGKMGAER